MRDSGLFSRRRFASLLASLGASVPAFPLTAWAAIRIGLGDDDIASFARRFAGDVIPRGHPNYEAWRLGMTWQLRKSQRLPDVIIRPQSVDDVVAAVKFAARAGAKIAVHSGGHSWVSSSVRDGGMLLDMGNFRDLHIDAGAMTAAVGPAIRGRELINALDPHALAFPVAHCSTVGLGGYLLGGGQAWNWGSWGGPACNSILALDVVDVRGEILRVDTGNHGDLFWAARGAGPGFPAIVTRYHLRLYPRPEAIHFSTWVWPLAGTLPVSRWLPKVGATLSDKVELYMFLMSLPEPVDGVQKVVMVTAVAFADTAGEARELLAPLSEAGTLGKPLTAQELQPATLGSLLDLVDRMYPPCRAVADTFWFDLSMEEVMANYVDHFASVPSPLSNVLCEVKPKPVVLPDAAYSMRRLTFLSPYSFWMDEKEDAPNLDWMRKTQEILAPLAVGHYINEADLEAGPDRSERSYRNENWRRIMAVRKKYDPDGLFHTYLGREV
jgi:FAD/FMN-containing dehydrogenase